MRAVRIRAGRPLSAERQRELIGAVLTRDVRVGAERWSKGRRLSVEDVACLGAGPVAAAAPGRDARPLTLLVLEPGDLHEDDAALRLATAVAGGDPGRHGLALRGPSESRIDLLAAADGVLHVRTAALERIDRLDPLEVFTALDGQVAARGDLVASVKVAPHVVPASVVEEAVRLSGRGIVRLSAFRPRRVGAIVKESLHAPGRERFERSVRGKVEALGSRLTAVEYVEDAVEPVTAALARLVRGGLRVDLVLAAGGASTDPLDPFYLAIERLGGRVVRHGVPAHPGSMLWLARIGRTDLVGLPTCGAFSKATAADLLIPRLLAGERADARTVARLGHGGLLTRDMRFRMPAYARELEAPEG